MFLKIIELYIQKKKSVNRPKIGSDDRCFYLAIKDFHINIAVFLKINEKVKYFKMSQVEFLKVKNNPNFSH